MKERARGLVVAAVVAATAPATTRAWADEAAAQALFDEGRRLMTEGNLALACPKLEESNRLAPGVGTKFNLADCHERAGRTASAWAGFLAAAAAARAQGRADREEAARARARALEVRLSKLIVDVAPAARATPGLEVKRDGVVLGAVQWGATIPVDPGTHVVTATAAGRRPWSVNVIVTGAGSGAPVIVPALEETFAAPAVAPPGPAATGVVAHGSGATAPATSSTTGASSAATNATPAPEPGSDGRAQRTIGLVVGGAGLIGVGIGAALGLRAIAKYDESAAHCKADGTCSDTGLALRDASLHAGTASTVAFIAGGVAIVGGLILVLTAPSGRAPATLTRLADPTITF